MTCIKTCEFWHFSRLIDTILDHKQELRELNLTGEQNIC